MKIVNKEMGLVMLNKEEIEIIDAALNNRMVRLQTFSEKDETWAKKAWEKTLDLQVEWFYMNR